MDLCEKTGLDANHLKDETVKPDAISGVGQEVNADGRGGYLLEVRIIDSMNHSTESPILRRDSSIIVHLFCKRFTSVSRVITTHYRSTFSFRIMQASIQSELQISEYTG